MTADRWEENGLLRTALQPIAPACAEHMELVSLGQMAHLHDAADEWVYFPLDALVAIQLGARGRAFQVGLIGNQGAIGLHRLIAGDFPALAALVLKGGEAFRVRRTALLAALLDNAAVQVMLARYVVSTAGDFLTEAATATTLTLERRVARWIADSSRMLERSDIRFTHQDIASALGVRRSGVTVALHILEGEGLIRSRRAQISLLDRPRLERAASLIRPVGAGAERNLEATPEHTQPAPTPGRIRAPQPV